MENKIETRSASVGHVQRLMTIDLTLYYQNQLCPRCDCPRDQNYPDSNDAHYARYLESAAKRFGDQSLPVCSNCYCEYCEICEFCGIPLEIAFARNFGDLMLRQTTITGEEKDLDHICTVCSKVENQALVQESRQEQNVRFNNLHQMLVMNANLADGEAVSWDGSVNPPVLETNPYLTLD